MRRIKINRADLELAFQLSGYEANAYLERETGAVMIIAAETVSQLDNLAADAETLDEMLAALDAEPHLSNEDRQQLIEAAQVEWDNQNRYLLIPKQDAREAYCEMEDFIYTVKNMRLREQLEIAIDGKGAFRRFKDTLARHPEIERQWFEFSDQRLQQRLLSWLADEEIEPEFIDAP
jgi:hypothetical protein